jgi:hypothetical protein
MAVRDVTPPAVVNVLVAGSSWSSSFLSYLSANNMGTTDGFSIVGANQLKSLPWTNINQIKIVFSEDVTTAGGVAALSDLLALGGVSIPNYAISGFSYNSAKHMGVWTLAAPLTADKLTLSLSDQITDLAGNNLDGEWTDKQTTPSGNASAGGIFTAHLNVLAGDVDRSNFVLGTDTTLVLNKEGLNTHSVGYNAFYDVNADGFILGTDVTLVYNRQGGKLPAGTPPTTPFTPANIVSPSDAGMFSIVSNPDASLVGSLASTSSVSPFYSASSTSADNSTSPSDSQSVTTLSTASLLA